VRDAARDAGSGVIAVAGGLVVLARWWPGPEAVWVIGAFVAAHAVTTPTGRARRVTAAPAVVSAGLLVSEGSAALVLGSAGVGLPIGWLLLRLMYGSRVASHVVPAEWAGVLAGSLTGAGLLALVPGSGPSDPLSLTMVAIAAAVGFGVVAASRAVFAEEGRTTSRLLIAMRSLLDWPAYLSLYGSAALFAVALGPMGMWALPLASIPYGFSLLSLHWLHDTRLAYDQTIASLGAIPEAADRVSPGHSSRTADLALRVGADLSLGPRRLRTVHRAALLRDIGRVVLSNPAVLDAASTPSDVSQWSAAIIGEMRGLDRVATVVAGQHPESRWGPERRVTPIPIDSQIVRFVARVDDALQAGADRSRVVDDLQQELQFDPKVVDAVRRVLRRQVRRPAESA